MKVRILRHTVAAGTDVFEGSVLVLEDSEAKELIRMGKAEEDTGEAPARRGKTKPGQE